MDTSGRSAWERSRRDWIVDTTCIVLAAAAGPVPVGLGGVGPEPVTSINIVVGVLACAALWWRRHRPVTVVIVSIVAGGAFPAAMPAAAIALFTIAVHCTGATVAVVSLLNLLAPLPRYVLFSDPRYPWWVPPLLTVVGTAVVVGWGLWVQARRQLVNSLLERARRVEADHQLKMDQARRNERTRIAREMHDALAHRISMLNMHAGALEFRPDAPADEIAHAAGTIRTSAHQAAHDLREVLGVLRDDEPEHARKRPLPGLTDLRDLITETRQAGMNITWHDELVAPEQGPLTLGRTTYRIVQEALTNAHKHAPDQPVTVSTTGGPGEGVYLDIRNHLAEATALPGSGTGLVGLVERAHLAGGELDHGFNDAGQFRLSAWLPWP